MNESEDMTESEDCDAIWDSQLAREQQAESDRLWDSGDRSLMTAAEFRSLLLDAPLSQP